MIDLNARFQYDILNRDLNLFPVVHITTQTDREYIMVEQEDEDGEIELVGEWIDIPYDSKTDINISTKAWSWGKGKSYMPLLLNVPSIRESVDLENRKYKISDVSLRISNARYEGFKFSDRAREELEYYPGLSYRKPIGFMNQSVKIYWVNQSTATKELESQEEFESLALLVYSGFIRRYSHDDDIVTLHLEDTTQRDLHKNVPATILGDGDEVPDSYKLQPVPMVYGHVNLSPCVIRSNAVTEVGISDVKLGVDSKPVEGFPARSERHWYKKGLYNLDTHPLWVFRNDTYLNVVQTGRTVDPAYEHTGSNYTTSIGNTDTQTPATITITPRFKPGDTSLPNEGLNAPGNGFMDCNLFRIPVTVELKDTLGDNHEAHLAAWTNFENLTKHNQEPATMSWGSEGHAIGNQFGMVLVPTYSYVGDDDIWYVNSYTAQNAYWWHIYSEGEEGESPAVPPVYFRVDMNYAMQGTHSFPNDHPDEAEGIPMGTDVAHNNFHNIIYPPIEAEIVENFDLEDEDFDFPVSGANWDIGSLAPSPIWYWFIGMSGDGIPAELELSFKGFGLFQKVLLNKYNKGPFYANVNGRIDGRDVYTEISYLPIQKPCDIIYHILGEELRRSYDFGSDGEEWFNQGNWINTEQLAEARDVFKEWKMAFTVDKTINSKKLIEGIGAESRCFPYLRGEILSFNVIKDSYEPIYIPLTEEWILPEDFSIESQDAISYKFDRTKIDDIKTKVVLHYHYDYAEDKFLKSTEDLNVPQTAQDLFSSYDKSFYNIEGEQGDDPIEIKYIRHDDDAEDIEQTIVKLKNFLLGMHCNQHILCNIRLPLSYLNVEVGDICVFKGLLGGSLAYGIDYTAPSGLWYDPHYWADPPGSRGPGGGPDPDDPFSVGGVYKEEINGQSALPYFIVTQTKKTLEYVELDLYQLHRLDFEWTPFPPDPTVEAIIHPSYNVIGQGGDVITLDGTHSYDPGVEGAGEYSYPDNGITTYRWTQISGGDIETYNDINDDNSVVDIELEDNYSGQNQTILFRLKVFNEDGISDAKIIHITNLAQGAIQVSVGGAYHDHIADAVHYYAPTLPDEPQGWDYYGIPEGYPSYGQYIISSSSNSGLLISINSVGQDWELLSNDHIGGVGWPLSSWTTTTSGGPGLTYLEIFFQDTMFHYSVQQIMNDPFLWSRWRYIFKGSVEGTAVLDIILQGGDYIHTGGHVSYWATDTIVYAPGSVVFGGPTGQGTGRWIRSGDYIFMGQEAMLAHQISGWDGWLVVERGQLGTQNTWDYLFDLEPVHGAGTPIYWVNFLNPRNRIGSDIKLITGKVEDEENNK